MCRAHCIQAKERERDGGRERERENSELRTLLLKD